MSGTSFLDHFSGLEDPRQLWKVGYPLPEILLVVLCGTIAGAENFVEVERWANRKLAFLRRLLAFRRGVPSHDTLTDVLNALPAAAFSECFTAWVDRLRESEPDIVAIDGKTSRRARRGAAHPLHLVSPGRRASASSSARRPWPRRATRSRPSRCCSSGSS